jgi:two-component system, LytTR family, response regulator LytT
MKVIIIEDEAPAIRRLEKLLKEIIPTIEIIETFDSISSSTSYLSNHPRVDLIFSDIQLADGLSFEIFQQVKVTSPIIFTTAFNEYAIRAFKVNSIDYLLKPIDIKLLRLSIEKYQNLKKSTSFPELQPLLNQLLANMTSPNDTFRQRFLVNYRDTFQRIDIEEIAYFLSENKLTQLVTHEGKSFIIPETLEELESSINPRLFFRANRQFLINSKSIQQIFTHFAGKLKIILCPSASQEVYVSRIKATIFKQWLNR